MIGVRSRSQDPPPLSETIARNTLGNVVTQLAMVAIAFWSIPRIVHGLTQEGFGLLSLIWAFVGYFALLDFGISRANTKFLAEAIARGDAAETRTLIWISIALTATIGVASGLILIAATPMLVHNVLGINAAFEPLALDSLRFAALSIPFLLVFGALRGIQTAFQRFDMVNLFQGLSGVIQWGGSVILLALGYGLKEVIVLTIGFRVILCLAAFMWSSRLVPGFFSQAINWDRAVFRKVFIFGGWVTVSQVVGPLLLYLDRIFIGRFLSLGAVTQYAVPQEALTRVLIIPLSLTSTLFPAMSDQLVRPPEQSKAGVLYLRSVKYLSIIMFPIAIVLLIHAPVILTLWMGKTFADQSSTVFRILAVGLFFNALAQIPVTALHAQGHPRLTALFHLLELPLMVVLNISLIPMFGIVGAAISWSIRVIIDAVLLFLGVHRVARHYLTPALVRMSFRRIFIQVMLGAALSSTSIILHLGTIYQIGITGVCILAYLLAEWFFGFDDTDRHFVLYRLRPVGTRA